MRLKMLAATLLAGAAMLIGAGPAAAHAALLSTDPADQSSVSQGPPEVSLTFNEAISPNFATLTVVGPDGNLWSKGDPTVSGSTVSVKVGDLGPAGEYKMAFRVTSADGHVIDGVRGFTLTQDGTGTPGEAVKKPSEDGSSNLTVWIFVGVAAVAFAVALGFALRRPKKD